jgi:2-oxoisovalerate dehydrogenase E1 component alpha subunit
MIDAMGREVDDAGDLAMPASDILLQLYRGMVIGRRFNSQATALAKQGRLAVYPSSAGQEACQVAAVLALNDRDWLFPTYRDTVAIVMRSVDPIEALSLLRGDWHCGYDPYQYRVAPQCTPLARSPTASNHHSPSSPISDRSNDGRAPQARRPGQATR